MCLLFIATPGAYDVVNQKAFHSDASFKTPAHFTHSPHHTAPFLFTQSTHLPLFCSPRINLLSPPQKVPLWSTHFYSKHPSFTSAFNTKAAIHTLFSHHIPLTLLKALLYLYLYSITTVPMQDAYKTFERGTPAGNMLYKLYNGKKKMDSTLDKALLARLQEQRKRNAAIETPIVKAVPKSRARVNVPRPTGFCAASDIHHCGRAPPPRAGRRRQNESVAELKAREVEMAVVPPPQRKLLGDAAKESLQKYMEHEGHLPPLPAPKPPPRPFREVKQEEIDALRTEFSEVQDDLAGYQRSLHAVVTNPVKNNKVEAALRKQVNGCISHMRELNYLIQQEEKML